MRGDSEAALSGCGFRVDLAGGTARRAIVHDDRARAWLGGCAGRRTPAVPTVCDVAAPAPFCQAVRGDRSEGWRAQSRSEVIAQHGMVAASQPLAAQAGLQVLMQGGNAIDAAVATAAVLNVAEPMMTGIGGDFFAIVYIAKEKKLYALNASGMAPTGATIERLHALGHDCDPQTGAGLGHAAIRDPARHRARCGVGMAGNSPSLRHPHFQGIARAGDSLCSRRCAGLRAHRQRLAAAGHTGRRRRKPSGPDPDSVRAWYVGGKPPPAGTLFRNPDLAHTLELLQQHGAAAFYQGEVARAIVAKSTALGGTMTLADLASYRGEWREPVQTRYHGYDVFELPPPSQDWATLEMLNILQACLPRWAPGQTLATLGPRSPLYWHLMVEAKKLAYADLFAYNADPNVSAVPLDRLLSPAYAAAQCARVDPKQAAHSGTRARTPAREIRSYWRRPIATETWFPGSAATTRNLVQA